MDLLDLQAAMAGTLVSLQEWQRELERLPAGPSTSHDRKQVDEVAVCKRARLIVKQVADGIAWRSLKYDRAAVRQLALKPHTGHLELEPAIHEIATARAHIDQTGDLVVVNDLTNFLRYGDFTSVSSTRVTIHEVKRGRGAAKSGRARRQRHKLESVLDLVRTSERRTPSGLERLHRYQVEPRSRLSEVSSLIKEARAKGQARARLGDCLAVQLFDVQQIAGEADVARKGGRSLIHDPFEQSNDAMRRHSLELFAEFTPNIAPYSVFPLSDQDCTDIMLGRIWLVSYFNLGNLLRCLRRRGLWAKWATSEDMAKLAMSDERASAELESSLLVSRGPPHPLQLVGWPELGRLFYEFLDEECFADTVENLIDSNGSGETAVFGTAFANEGTLWD